MIGIKSSRVVAFVGFLSLSATAAYFFWKLESSSGPEMGRTEHPQSQLAVSLRKAPSALGVVLTVTNTGTAPVTILTWESPLDPLALQLGLIYLTPAEAKEPLDLPVIKVSRQLPPDDASLVTIDPGASEENEIIFREPLVPLDQVKGKTVAVDCRGKWMSVWFAGEETSFKGNFKSNHLETEM